MPKRDGETVLGLTAKDHVGLHITGALLCGVGGYFLPPFADVASDWSWMPFYGPLTTIASLEGAWVAVVAALVGLVAGVLLARAVIRESLHVAISDDTVRVTKDGRSRTIAREDVSVVFLDQKRLVIVDADGVEIVREKPEARPAEVEEAFTGHGYPWSDSGDPYAAEFRGWEPDSPDMPTAANAVLKARQYAVDKRHAAIATELRDELAKLGIVVRDSGKRQSWRPASPPDSTQSR